MKLKIVYCNPMCIWVVAMFLVFVLWMFDFALFTTSMTSEHVLVFYYIPLGMLLLLGIDDIFSHTVVSCKNAVCVFRSRWSLSEVASALLISVYVYVFLAFRANEIRDLAPILAMEKIGFCVIGILCLYRIAEVSVCAFLGRIRCVTTYCVKAIGSFTYIVFIGSNGIAFLRTSNSALLERLPALELERSDATCEMLGDEIWHEIYDRKWGTIKGVDIILGAIRGRIPNSN